MNAFLTKVGEVVMGDFILNRQLMLIAEKAINSLDDLFLCDPKALVQGFCIESRSYNLTYGGSKGRFNLTIEINGLGEIRYFIKTGCCTHKCTCKKRLRECSKQGAITALSNFYKGE
ncbi:hypothetical protein [Pseudoalteromonas sp. MelDa3]|uniref:hypothetical protein n=1 Tax=Pseudoalteromonas sp. MelDa3 TaxID=888435 RepID=UPI000CB86BFD|nr:hypothetical protein [Pseudoalteromonas sp. MelDa3]PLT23518.1 hypothetical protein CXF89_19275 [Pseudoalteromonas sp. MelDa3]